MRKQESQSNKGFSLVELIIVIAIMAILVGVLAPQLIRYVEKTNVSADTQLADAVKTAVTVAMMDPSVINAKDSSASMITAMTTATNLSYLNGTGTKFQEAVWETLGVTSQASLETKIKSAYGGSGIQVQIVGANAVKVTILTTDSDGKKDTKSTSPIVVE